MAAVVFAVFVGMAAGYFPALRAMRLSLWRRYEMTKKKEAEYSVSFFYNLDFQIIKINRIHKIVLIETRFAVPFKFLNSRIHQIGLLRSNS